MAASSVRVRHIVELVAELSDEERLELEAELGGQEASVGRAWGDEIDQRAARASRPECAALPLRAHSSARDGSDGSTGAVVSGSDIASMIGIDPEAAYEILDARDSATLDVRDSAGLS